MDAGRYLIAINSTDVVKSVPLTAAAIEVMYGEPFSFSAQSGILEVPPGETVAVHLLPERALGLYDGDIRLTYINKPTAVVEGKTENTEVYFAIYTQREDGVKELVHIERNSTYATLPPLQEGKYKIGLFHWGRLVPEEDPYKISEGFRQGK